MTKNKRNILTLLLTIFALFVGIGGFVSINNSKIVNASNRWYWVTIEAKLSDDSQVPFANDDNLFTTNHDDAQYGLKWYIGDVWSINSEDKIVSASKNIQLGTPYGNFPTVVEGYDEVEWKDSDNNTITQNSNFNKVGGETIYLIADYHKYNITYKNCEGVSNSNPTYHTIKNNVTINPVSKPGYTFLGWKNSINNSDSVQSFVIPANVMSDVTMAATWEPYNYQVRFNANGADTGTMINQSFVYGTEDVLNDLLYRNSSKNFAGWATTSSGKPIYCNRAKVKNLTAQKNGIFNLYAIWTDQNVYQVKFYANNGTGHMNNQPFIYGVEQNLNENLFTRTGFRFIEWNTKSDGKGTKYQDEEFVNNLTATNKDVFELYAIWQENTYTIKFDSNGGQGEMNPQTLKYTQIQSLFKNTFSNEDLEFACWNTKSDGSGEAYVNCQKISRLTEDEEITLYAIWQPKTSKGISQNTIIILVFASVVVIGVVVTTVLVKRKN